MKKPSNIGHITPADTNIFLELGFPADEAVRYLAASDAIIAQKRKDAASLNRRLSTKQTVKPV